MLWSQIDMNPLIRTSQSSLHASNLLIRHVIINNPKPIYPRHVITKNLTAWHQPTIIQSPYAKCHSTDGDSPQLSPLYKHNPLPSLFTPSSPLSLLRLLSTLIMSRNYNFTTLLILIFLFTISNFQKSFSSLVTQQPMVLKYHNGDLLRGPLTINLVWYGKFTPIQRSIIVDFLQSLNTFKSSAPPHPAVSTWWKTTEKYHNGSSATVVGKQILDENYSLGKLLKNYHLKYLATKVAQRNSVNVVLTGKEVGVDGFCMSRCGTHGWSNGKGSPKVAYAWVGNSETQCPGQCAWPFHQPIYGPQTAPLVSPNGDVGVDGIVINLATVLAGAVTNPFNEGFFQGPATAPLEAVSACTGMFGSGSYPGYAGVVLVDKSTGASYNAHGLNGRKYLVPAMWDPKTSACSTLV